MPEFYIIITRKIFFSIFFWGGGGAVTPSPVSYVYAGNARLPTVVRENDGYR